MPSDAIVCPAKAATTSMIQKRMQFNVVWCNPALLLSVTDIKETQPRWLVISTVPL
jgi:hypothetical protein